MERRIVSNSDQIRSLAVDTLKRLDGAQYPPDYPDNPDLRINGVILTDTGAVITTQDYRDYGITNGGSVYKITIEVEKLR